MRSIRAFLLVPIHGRIAAAIRRWRIQWIIIAAFALKTLLPCPRFNQCSIHGKVLVRQQLLVPGLPHDQGEELLGNRALQQPIPVLRKDGRMPYRLVG